MPKGYQKRTVNKMWNSVVHEFERKSRPISITGLMKATKVSNEAAKDFLTAVTQGYNQKEHGFTLARIFDMDENGYLHQRDTRNPKDASLYVLIGAAMNHSKKVRLATKDIREESAKIAKKVAIASKFSITSPLAKFSNQELLDELSKRMEAKV